MTFTKNDRVVVNARPDRDTDRAGVVAYTYEDGATVGVLYDGARFPCVVPSRYVRKADAADVRRAIAATNVAKAVNRFGF